MRALYIGVDAGGTRTRAVVAAPDLVPLGRGAAGPGTVALGRNAGGDTARAGGWGPLIGDEGSAYAIGRRALAAVVADIDGRTGSTLMTGLLFDEEGSEPARELVGRLTTAGASP